MYEAIIYVKRFMPYALNYISYISAIFFLTFLFSDLYFFVEWKNGDGHSVISAKQLQQDEHDKPISDLGQGDTCLIKLGKMHHKAVVISSGKLVPSGLYYVCL